MLRLHSTKVRLLVGHGLLAQPTSLQVRYLFLLVKRLPVK